MARVSDIKELDRQKPRFIKRFSVSLTEEQYNRLNAAAEASGLTLSDLVRRRVNGVAIPKVHVGIMQGQKNLIAELARQGGLIKHLYSKETAAALGAWQKFFFAALRDYEELRAQFKGEVTPL